MKRPIIRFKSDSTVITLAPGENRRLTLPVDFNLTGLPDADWGVTGYLKAALGPGAYRVHASVDSIGDFATGKGAVEVQVLNEHSGETVGALSGPVNANNYAESVLTTALNLKAGYGFEVLVHNPSETDSLTLRSFFVEVEFLG